MHVPHAWALQIVQLDHVYPTESSPTQYPRHPVIQKGALNCIAQEQKNLLYDFVLCKKVNPTTMNRSSLLRKKLNVEKILLSLQFIKNCISNTLSLPACAYNISSIIKFS